MPPWPCTNLAGHHHHHPRQRYALAARRQSVAYAGGRASERSISGIFPRPLVAPSASPAIVHRSHDRSSETGGGGGHCGQPRGKRASGRPPVSLVARCSAASAREGRLGAVKIRGNGRASSAELDLDGQLHPVKARPCSLHLSTVHVIQDPTTHVPCPFNCC